MNTQQTISINIKSCKKKILDSYFIFHINGKIIRKMKSGKWKEIKNSSNHKEGYNVIMINGRQFTRNQLIAHIFMNYDIYDKTNMKNKMITFKDKNKLNCSTSNLIICSKNYYLSEIKNDK